MDPARLRAIVEHLQDLVSVGEDAAGAVAVFFPVPPVADLVAAGLDAELVRRLLGEPWWDEMVGDVVSTPDLCAPDDPPAQVLAYARDVVHEYVAKRFTG